MPQQGRQSVREQRDRGQRERRDMVQLRATLDDQVREQMPALDAILPSHLNAAQFVAIMSGLLARNDDLAYCAVMNPASFIAAMADCARYGLTPGDGYAFVPFGANGQSKSGPEVVGMREYTGEIELIYRTELVESVQAEVVFEHDHYRPGKHAHDAPEWSRGPTEFATDEERGKPLGAFCYCILKDGGISRVVRMNRQEIMLHRDVAKTKDVWDGPFWRSAWLKTVAHEQYKWVAKSSEYLRELLRASAALDGGDLGALPRPNPTTIGARNGGQVAMLKVPAIGSPQQQDDPGSNRGTRRRKSGYERILELFERIGCTAPSEQLAVVQAVMPEYVPGAPFTDKQAEPIIARLQSFIDDADEPPQSDDPADFEDLRTPYDVLRDYLATPGPEDGEQT